MYLTIEETAEMLDITEEYIEKLIIEKKIRALYDGENYLIFKGQFNTHLEQVDKYKIVVEEYWNEPIPEDIDVKDED